MYMYILLDKPSGELVVEDIGSMKDFMYQTVIYLIFYIFIHA